MSVRRRAITVTGGEVGGPVIGGEAVTGPVIDGTVEQFVADDREGIFLFVAAGTDAVERLRQMIAAGIRDANERQAAQYMLEALLLMRRQPRP